MKEIDYTSGNNLAFMVVSCSCPRCGVHLFNSIIQLQDEVILYARLD